MKLNKTAYVAVIGNKILEHPEGAIIGEDAKSVKREATGVWAKVCGWDTSEIRIVKVRIVEEE